MDGKVDRAREVSIEAAKLWEKLNNQPMLADSLGGLVAINVFSGDFDMAYRYSDKAYEISKRIENVWGQSYSRYAIGFVDMERGDIDLAIQHFSQSLQDAKESNFFAGIILTQTFLSFLYSDLGHYQLAIDMVDSVFDDQHSVDDALINSFFLGAKLLSRVRAGKLDEAEKLISQEKFMANQMNFFARQYAELALCHLLFVKRDFESSIYQSRAFLEQLQSNGVQYLTPELLLLIAKSQIALGSWEDAWATLENAQEKIGLLGSRRSKWQVDYLLGHCALHDGDHEIAQECFYNSRETLTYILDNISDDALKEHFLQREDVQFVLNAVVEPL
jgi:tetratricopeptide (TPR) repeat protein